MNQNKQWNCRKVPLFSFLRKSRVSAASITWKVVKRWLQLQGARSNFETADTSLFVSNAWFAKASSHTLRETPSVYMCTRVCVCAPLPWGGRFSLDTAAAGTVFSLRLASLSFIFQLRLKSVSFLPAIMLDELWRDWVRADFVQEGPTWKSRWEVWHGHDCHHWPLFLRKWKFPCPEFVIKFFFHFILVGGGGQDCSFSGPCRTKAWAGRQWCDFSSKAIWGQNWLLCGLAVKGSISMSQKCKGRFRKPWTYADIANLFLLPKSLQQQKNPQLFAVDVPHLCSTREVESKQSA